MTWHPYLRAEILRELGGTATHWTRMVDAIAIGTVRLRVTPEERARREASATSDQQRGPKAARERKAASDRTARARRRAEERREQERQCRASLAADRDARRARRAS